ncbi:MAG: DNA translocase FtsK [Lachnospiraceae bacterium]|jgi:S-DNA-T family DNA segregation ATPase FtsK/SpoIIIE|nr:DNA translocase FtsK [Lachnospiraceae bacterium]
MAKGKKKEQKSEKKEKQELSPFEKELGLMGVIVVAIIFVLSYMNAAGVIGQALNTLSFGLIGILAYLMPFFIIGVAFFYTANKDNDLLVKKVICACMMSVVLMALLQLITFHYDSSFNLIVIFNNSATRRAGGGLIGGIFANLLALCFGEWGAYVILFALLAIGAMFLSEKLFFHSLKRKSSSAYKKIKERAEIAAQEYAKEKEQDELDELEDWEQEKSRKVNFPFFDFKKEAKRMDDSSGNMREITGDLQEEAAEKPKDENEEDFLSDLVIHRADEAFGDREREEKDSFDIQIPLYEQEIQPEFQEPQKTESDKFMEEVENSLRGFADEFEIQKGEDGEGIVMDAVDEQEMVSPTQAISQLAAPIKNPTAKPDSVVAKNAAVPKAESKEVTQTEVKKVKKKKPRKYIFPSPELLVKPEKSESGISDESLKESAKKLQTTLESFGVGAKVTNVSCGPTVTRYELQPDQGVKVSKITALVDDIKLNMAAEEIRIEAPIPGKAAVGIEVPNATTSVVHFRDLVENAKFRNHKSKIAFAVGKDIGGQVVVSDIAKMPHLLIAGATGSGKSVCINTLIMSILYKAHPDDVKLIMIDPKVVELSCYKGIPHLLIPVVTDPKKASAALQWAVQEMTERYNKFAELGVREITGYNEKVKAVEYAEDERFQKMPQIVIIVDELADLMMVASKEVEDAICRLAQLARAAGIHLVIATQRPSVNVITGLIKANVPSRIAFAVSSSVDSRTILDGGGAEKLLGKGDMLFYPSGFPKPVRVQGAFVSDEEVNAVVSFIREKNEMEQDDTSAAVEAKMEEVVSIASGDGNGAKNDNDDYFVEAGRFIIEKNKASIAMLQRVYKIGFNRAARIMDQLCAAGVVGPEEGTKPRKVLMTMEEFDSFISG